LVLVNLHRCLRRAASTLRRSLRVNSPHPSPDR
jgi:hypothetical protein